jgi:putative CocE/NonD family hydrolase
MSLASRLAGLAMRLPPAVTHDLVVTPDIPVPMPDGVSLLADLYQPRAGSRRPVILLRSPYGRKALFGFSFGRLFAERGFQVVIQSCRGTFGSGGDFRYAHDERADGLATVAWMREQPWYGGELVLIGESYLGFAGWAIAADIGPELRAMIHTFTTADFNHFRYQGGTVCLANALVWSAILAALRRGVGLVDGLFILRTAERAMRKAAYHLPLGAADQVLLGARSLNYQETMEHPGPDPDYWRAADYRHRLPEVRAPIDLIAGWYDMFLAEQLVDYRTLRAADAQPYLLIGPWTHGASGQQGLNETWAWLRAHLQGDPSRLRKLPIRLFVMGANTWRDYADWPPPARAERWYLQPGGGLAPTVPASSEPDRYRYDPADPTPSLGGNYLGGFAGAKDNRRLEVRPDVLVYTSDVLREPLEVIGPLSAELYVRSSLEHTDFFVRLCVVEPSGRSTNLCDGIIRLAPGSASSDVAGVRRVQIEIWPTAYRFRPGQRLRVQVSSGAHPRFVRNLGAGESIATATTMRVAEQEIFHDAARPSHITLPVVSPA